MTYPSNNKYFRLFFGGAGCESRNRRPSGVKHQVVIRLNFDYKAVMIWEVIAQVTNQLCSGVRCQCS